MIQVFSQLKKSVRFTAAWFMSASVFLPLSEQHATETIATPTTAALIVV
jgi:hypothetical protein